MKRTFGMIFVFIVLIFTVTFCSEKNEHDDISKELGIDVSAGREISSSDTHGGFHGDGISYIALQFSDDTVLEDIKSNSAWKSFPLDETVQALVYGVSDEASSIGPFLNDNEGNPIVPEIQNGYYLLIDRQTNEETDILSRPSFNLTVGLYDTDTNILYCCELDT